MARFSLALFESRRVRPPVGLAPAADMTTNVCEAAPVARQAGATGAAWSGVFAVAICVFALIASEFMPVSLLTPIAADLHVNEGPAGQGVAISGAFAIA